MKNLSFLLRTIVTFVFVVTLLFVSTSAFAEVWRFGVMADTQWIGADDGRSPNSVPVDIIKKLNTEFINKGVKFVIEVGDLCDNGSINGEDTRAAFAQELYNAGVGFFPFRGNHDSSKAAAIEFQRIYPQTQNGMMNNTPANVFTVPNPDSGVQPFPVVSGSAFPMGSNFSSPQNYVVGGIAYSNLNGLSYSFDYNNVRFVMIDGQAGGDTNGITPGVDPQQPWITAQLSGRPAGTHAFVMSHKGLITENHVDVLFGSDPSKDPAGQNAFISSLQSNGVRYYLGGHDHMHNRSIITSPDQTSSVQDLLCASDSSKFYTPGSPSNDQKYNVPAFGFTRQTQIAQELHRVGYYIFTLDGPRVTVDYYSAPSTATPNGCAAGSPNCEYLITTTPALNFAKAETFGYSLNGHEYLVAQGQSYTAVNENYKGTSAQIVDGINGSIAADYDGRHFTKAVDTGWTDGTVSTPKSNSDTASNILTLWGMSDLYATHTDTYTLSLSYDPSKSRPEHLGVGLFGLATRDENGNWVNAVTRNIGGIQKFVMGPWQPGYGLGTYGVDPGTKTAWAVINYNADFAVARFNQ